MKSPAPATEPCHGRRATAREHRRILIIKPSSPGDIVHALPVLRGLRARYPDAHIAWLVATPFINMLDAEPLLNEVIPFDRKYFGRIGRSVRATLDFWRFVRNLRAKKFDLVVDLQGLLRSAFMSLFSGARERIGFRGSREFAWLFYNRQIPRQPPDMHAADKLRAVDALLDLPRLPLDFRLAIQSEDRVHAQRLLDEAGIRSDHRFALLVPGTRWETKRWPPERFGELAVLLRRRLNLASVLVGSAADFSDGQTAIEAARHSTTSDNSAPNALHTFHVSGSGDAAGQPENLIQPNVSPPPFESRLHNFCGKTTFRQLAALIERAAVVVTADSAPMHMAAAHGRPLVALFGPTNPERTGPHGRLADVIRLPLDCSPCYFRRLTQCPFGQRCMRELTAEQIASEVARRIIAGGAVAK